MMGEWWEWMCFDRGMGARHYVVCFYGKKELRKRWPRSI